MSAQLKRLITLLSHSAVICFQVQQGSLCSTLTTRVELWVCVCGGEKGEGGEKETNYLRRRVQDGKPLVSCAGKDWSISPEAKITWYLQEVRLQREYRERK